MLSTGALVLTIAIIFIAVGVAGTVIPLVPGLGLIFVTIAAYGWYEGFHVITPRYLAILAGLTVLSMLLTYLSAMMGAKFTGSSRAGAWGAIIGTLIGLFILPPLGLLLGPWLGAFIGEYIQCHNYNQAFKAGIGAVIGMFSSMLVNVVLALIMLISFLIMVF